MTRCKHCGGAIEVPGFMIQFVKLPQVFDGGFFSPSHVESQICPLCADCAQKIRALIECAEVNHENDKT